MLKQIFLLTKLLTINTGGINELRFSKDSHKRNRTLMLGFAYLLVGGVLIMYVAMLSFGLIAIGAGDALPAYIFIIASLMSFFFTMYKAGSVLYESAVFEELFALPLSKSAIICSRFLTMYLKNLGFTAGIFLPALIVSAILGSPGVLFVLSMILGLLFAPLLPMTLASLIGGLITGISARMRHKNLINVLLSLGFITVFLVLTFTFSGNLEGMDTVAILTLVDTLLALLHKLYPPASLFTNAAVHGHIGGFLAFLLLSMLLFVLLIFLLQRKFLSITSLLKSSTAKSNYKMQRLESTSLSKSLLIKELKRYFASPLYVLNTSVGYILMLLLSVSLLFMGMESLDAMLGLPGVFSRILPFVLAFTCSLSPMTTSAISIEGKQWWILKSLPISGRQIIRAKLSANFVVALPFYLISVILLMIAAGGSLPSRLLLLVVPLVYLVFSSILGLAVNLKFPNFTWASETEIIKQGAPVLCTMIAGMLLSLIGGIISAVLPGTLGFLLCTLLLILMLTGSYLLYRHCINTDLRTL